MSIYVGDPVMIQVAPIDPVTKELIDDAVVTAELFEPGRNPRSAPEVRDSPDDGPYSLMWDADAVNRDGSRGAYVATVAASDVTPGRWSAMITITRGGRSKLAFTGFVVRP